MNKIIKSFFVIIFALVFTLFVYGFDDSDSIESSAKNNDNADSSLMDTGKFNKEPVKWVYQDMDPYQGLFYYGKPDSLIELKIDDGTSYLSVYSVNGNDINKISKEVITNFSSSTAILYDKYKVIYCKINDTEYRLVFAALSVEDLKTIIAEYKLPAVLSISIIV